MKNLGKFCFLILVVLCLINVAQAAPFVWLDTPSDSPAVGDTFKIGLIGDDFTDLYSFNFTVSYDPTLLRGISVEEGTLLSSCGTTFFIPGTIDDAAGNISFTGNTLLGAIDGATGSGSLATLQFEALSQGVTFLELSDLTFVDSFYNEIAVGYADGLLSIGNVSAVPEPSSLSLLLVAFGVSFFWLRRHKHNAL